MTNLFLLLLLAQNVPTEPTKVGAATGRLGAIYSRTNFTSLNDFTAVGFSPSVTNGMIHFPQGSGTYSQYLLLNGFTNMDENWSITVEYTNTAISGNYGLAIGKKSTGSITTLGTAGQLLYTIGGTPVIINPDSAGVNTSTSDVGWTVTAGDLISLTLSQNQDLVSLYYWNKTRNYFNSYLLNDPMNGVGSESIMSVAGQWCIWNVNQSGAIDISKVEVTSQSITNPPLMFVGDSKTRGAGVLAIESRFANVVARRMGVPVSVFAGDGMKTSDLMLCLPYLTNNFRPASIVLCIGRNDLAFGVSSNVMALNYTSFVSAVTGLGTRVYHLMPIPEGFDQSVLSRFIRNTYAKSNIVSLINPVELSPSVHPSAKGALVVADAISSQIYGGKP